MVVQSSSGCSGVEHPLIHSFISLFFFFFSFRHFHKFIFHIFSLIQVHHCFNMFFVYIDFLTLVCQSVIHSFLPYFLPSFLPSFIPFFPSFLHFFLPSFLPSFIHSFIHSFSHSFLPSFLPSFILSFLHSFIPSFLPSFLHSFLPSFLHSFFPSFLPSFLHSFIHSFIHSFLFIYPLLHSVFSFIHVFLHLFNDCRSVANSLMCFSSRTCFIMCVMCGLFLMLWMIFPWTGPFHLHVCFNNGHLSITCVMNTTVICLFFYFVLNLLMPFFLKYVFLLWMVIAFILNVNQWLGKLSFLPIRNKHRMKQILVKIILLYVSKRKFVSWWYFHVVSDFLPLSLQKKGLAHLNHFIPNLSMSGSV